MQFVLVSSVSLIFSNGSRIRDKTMTSRMSMVLVDKLESAGSTSSSSSSSLPRSAYFVTKLEDLLLVQGSREEKRQRLSLPIDSMLRVWIFYGALSPDSPNRKHTAYCKIDDVDDSNGLLKRLAGVCGGRKNIQARLELEFGTQEDKMKLSFDFKDLKLMFSSQSKFYFGNYFNFTESLSSQWSTQTAFCGTLSLSLNLNDNAVNLIHLGRVEVNNWVNRKLLEDAKEFGDVIIAVQNGKEFHCHKAILIAHSDVFRAMFTNDMKEAQSNRVSIPNISEKCATALLKYLYCCDLKDALSSSRIAMELLRVADMYGISRLFQAIKDIILSKENSWFKVSVGVQLCMMVKNRLETPDFKEMEEKAKDIIRSKSPDALKRCAEFRKQFKNRASGMEMFVYFM